MDLWNVGAGLFPGDPNALKEHDLDDTRIPNTIYEIFSK